MLSFIAALAFGSFDAHESDRSKQEWVSLFNGRSLDGWNPKIKGRPLGENFAQTFVARDGTIRVSYSGYGGKFENRFGHLFYKEKYGSYILRLEYRFLGEPLSDAPGWAHRNSGVMIHSQDPKSMTLEQDFPVSCEVQFLGGFATGERHTGNVCTPGTNIFMDGKLVPGHCTDSNSPTYRGEQWVRAEVEVHGHGWVVHRIEGQEVLKYEKVQLDPNDSNAKGLIKDGVVALSEGYIALQSEGHEIEFRNIRIRKLP